MVFQSVTYSSGVEALRATLLAVDFLMKSVSANGSNCGAIRNSYTLDDVGGPELSHVAPLLKTTDLLHSLAILKTFLFFFLRAHALVFHFHK